MDDIIRIMDCSSLDDHSFHEGSSVSSDTSAPISPANNTTTQVLHNEKQFIDDMSMFFNVADLSDIKVKVGNQTFYAHKFVLAKSSGVFRQMLYSDNWCEGKQSELELSETDDCQDSFEIFLRYLYTASITMTEKLAVGTLCLADKYDVISLRSLCVQYMCDNAKSPRIHNALRWYSIGKDLVLKDLLDQCSQTISWNMEAVIHLDEWTSMNVAFIQDLLNSSDLIVLNELSIYHAVCRWLLDSSRIEFLTDNSQLLLPLIRFPQMLVHQLYEVEESDLAKNKVCSEMIQQLLGKAYRFRALCPPLSGLDVSFHESFYQSRDYLDLTVDSVRMHNTLRFGIQVDVKMFVGPVPSKIRDGDWKITYRKCGDAWQLQVYSHESAMIQSEAKFQLVIIICDEHDKVVQVEKEPTFVCTRGNPLTCSIKLRDEFISHSMAVLIKPLP